MGNERLRKAISKGDRGKYFEGKFHEAVKSLQKRNPMYNYRFPDSRMAGRIIQPSPGDRLVLANGVSYLVELKESEVFECFTQAYRPFLQKAKNETAHMRMWFRAKGKGYYMFYSHLTDKVQVWTPPVVHRALYDKDIELTRENGLVDEYELIDLRAGLAGLLL